MRKQFCLSKPYSLKLGKNAADRQKRRQENKFKEVMKQIFVSLVGLVQTHGDNMEKGEFQRRTEETLSAMQMFQGELLLSAWDSMRQSMEACVRKASRRPWVLVQSKTQTGFSVLKEGVGRMRISHASP